MNREQSSRGMRFLISLAFVLVAFGFCGLSAVAVLAQDASASPSPSASPTPDEEMQRLEREKAEATLRKEKAEADKAAAEARKAEQELKFPAPSASPLEGKTSVEGAIIESQMVSYISMARAANRIIDAINSFPVRNSIRSLAVYNERDINLLLSYRTARSQVEITRQGYCSILAPAAAGNLCPAPLAPLNNVEAVAAPIAPLLAARSFLGAFIDATALLRTNVEIKGQTFVIDEGPLVAEVFRAARRPSFGLPSTVELYYPYVFPPNVSASKGSPLLAELERLRTLRVAGEKLAADLAEAQESLEEKKASIKQLTSQINEELPRRIGESVAASANIIKANCPALVPDVNAILALPEKPLQIAPMLRLIARISDERACPDMPAEKLEQLLSLKDAINGLNARLAKAKQDKSDAETEQAQLETKIATLKARLNPAFDPDDALAQLKALNAQFDNLVKTLVQADASGVNPLTNFIRTESLTDAVPAQGGYWLQLKVINAGGNNRIKTNLLVDLFTGGNRVSHSGGVIVQYNLFDSNGKSIVSDTIADYTNYIKAGRVRTVTNSKPDTARPASVSIDEDR